MCMCVCVCVCVCVRGISSYVMAEYKYMHIIEYTFSVLSAASAASNAGMASAKSLSH